MTVFLGAMIVGLTLGLLGSGGSILTVPILTYVLGHDQKIAVAESMAIVSGLHRRSAARLASMARPPE